MLPMAHASRRHRLPERNAVVTLPLDGPTRSCTLCTLVIRSAQPAGMSFPLQPMLCAALVAPPIPLFSLLLWSRLRT